MSACSYKLCTDSIFADTNDYCEIKTVLSNASTSSAHPNKSSDSCMVNWSPTGEAKLHTACWEIILKLSRKRKKNKTKHEPHMIETEKTLIKEAAKTVEYFDSREKMVNKAKKAAELIKSSKHCVCFTGAGISTSAGIGDYRGKSGKWTQQDQEKLLDSLSDEPSCKKSKSEPDVEEVEDDGVNYEELRPTYTHEALQKLMTQSLLKYVISQNGDGLHTLSKVPAENISELHGNVFMEKCEKCGARFERPYYVLDDNCSQYYEDIDEIGSSDIKKPPHAKQCSLCKLSHRTGRKCNEKGCKGYLLDTIINFKDNLDDDVYEKAVDNASKSDLMICLGTTLLVSPANELVEMTQEPYKIIICNRQKTPLDYLYEGKNKITGCRVYGDCDVFMKEVMKHILPADALSTWESARPDRLKDCDSLRNSK